MWRSGATGGTGATGAGLRGPTGAREDGFALLLVLFLLLLLTLVVGALTMRTAGAYRLAKSRAVGWQLYYASRSAMEEAKVKLWLDAYGRKGMTPGLNAPPRPMRLESDGVKVKVYFEDEAGKIPLNDFNAGEQAHTNDLGTVLSQMFETIGFQGSQSLAIGVRDYIDEDEQGLGENKAKNKPLYDVCELTMVKGFTPALLYRPQKEGRLPASMCLSTWHTGAININTAPAEVLAALGPKLTEGDLRRIMAERRLRPFTSVEDFNNRCGLSAEAVNAITKLGGFNTDTLTLKVEARLGSYVRRMQAVVFLESSRAHTLYIRDGWQE